MEKKGKIQMTKRNVSPIIHQWLLAIGDHLTAQEAIRRRKEAEKREYYQKTENDRRKKGEQEWK